jgi:hypothetical protein
MLAALGITVEPDIRHPNPLIERSPIMSSVSLIKNVVTFATSLGAAAVIGSFVKANVPMTGNFLVRTSVKLGTVAIANTLGDLSAKHLNEGLDEMVEASNGLAVEIKKAQEQFAKSKEENPDEPTES